VDGAILMCVQWGCEHAPEVVNDSLLPKKWEKKKIGSHQEYGYWYEQK
jgi:hypothetical protein